MILRKRVLGFAAGLAIASLASTAYAEARWTAKDASPESWTPYLWNAIRGVEGVFSGTRYDESGNVYSSDPISRLTNGAVNPKGTSYGDTFAIASGTLSWKLPEALDVIGLRINTHWGDGGRDGLNLLSVQYRQGEGDEWKTIPYSAISNGVNNNDSSGDIEFVFRDSSFGIIASGVTEIRFNLGEQDNGGSGFTEFEVWTPGNFVGYHVEYSDAVSLDTTQDEKIVENGMVDIVYDAAWSNGVTAAILSNGRKINEGEAGVYAWDMECCEHAGLLLEIRDESGEVTGSKTAKVVNSSPKKEHQRVVTKPGQPATSAGTGLTDEIMCAVCGKMLQQQVVIPALGYIRNVTARQLWPHNKVEIRYELAEDIGDVADADAALKLGYGIEGMGLASTDWGFSHDSKFAWEPDRHHTSNSRVGGYSWQSANANCDNSSSSISANVHYATKVTFWWMVSSQVNWDWLRFYVNDEEKIPGICGGVDWRQVTVSLDPDENQTLRWTYSKNWDVSLGWDCGWIDRVEIEFWGGVAQTIIGDARCAPGEHCVVWDLDADGVRLYGCEPHFTVKYGSVSGRAATVGVDPTGSVSNGMSVSDSMRIDYSPIDAGVAHVLVDGEKLISSTNSGSFLWQPLRTGDHTITHIAGVNEWTRQVHVESVEPNPPMATVQSISITPKERTLPQIVSGGAILTSGSGNWTAATSADWICLDATSGKAKDPVVYTVSANPDVGDRIGYVYVAGHVHKVTQRGNGEVLEKMNFEFGEDGGTEIIRKLHASDEDVLSAYSNCDWISVSDSDAGSGEVVIHVAPWHDSSARTGTITAGGQTVTVTQSGSAMSLPVTGKVCNRTADSLQIEVKAQDSKEWTVTPSASWITVTDSGSGKGCGSVSVEVAENTGWEKRLGWVAIGTELFQIAQHGSTEYSLSAHEAAFGQGGGSGGFEVETVAENLPWSATNNVDWLRIEGDSGKGVGSGTVAYSVLPQTTFYDRTGVVTVVTSAVKDGLPQTHTVIQTAATSEISISEWKPAASGDSTEVDVILNDGVRWEVENCPSWLSVNTDDRIGPEKVTLIASANDSIMPRSAVIRIARRDLEVVQGGRNCEIDVDVTAFGADGGLGTITVRPEADNVNWEVVSGNPSWITVTGGGKGVGEGFVYFVVSPLSEGEISKSGTILIRDHKVLVTQSASDVEAPSVTGDSAANITGNTIDGFLVKPGAGNRTVEVTIPAGVRAELVTVEVAPETVTVKPNGAKVKIVREANGERYDITRLLDVPSAVDGVVDIAGARVKEQYAKEPLDVEKGAVVTLDGETPAIKTAPTQKGLTYNFYEATTLEALFGDGPADTIVGNGEAWQPEISVKGGDSGFYSIKVEK